MVRKEMQVPLESLEEKVYQVSLVMMDQLVVKAIQAHRERRERQESFVSAAAEPLFCYAALHYNLCCVWGPKGVMRVTFQDIRSLNVKTNRKFEY